MAHLTRRQEARSDPVEPREAGASADLAACATRGSGFLHEWIKRLRDLPRADKLATLVLTLLVVVSYFPAILGGFVWDDMVFKDEPLIWEPSGLWKIWFSPANMKFEGHYWPIVYTSFWLEHKLWGFEPLGFHCVNVLLHLVNCMLVWRLMVRLAVPGAWMIAAVFAVHPLHVESVAWIIERKDLLSALFYLASALTWIRFAESPSLRRYLVALSLFVAAMLSKSIAVTLPAALLIWHWWKQRRVTAPDLWRLAPFFVVALCIAVADVSFTQRTEDVKLGYSLVERALIAAQALWFYAGKLVWPTELAVIYEHWEVDASDLRSWGFLGAAAMLAWLLWACRRRIGSGPFAGALFFAVTLSPVLGFVDYGYMQFSFVADRYQYLAGMGLIAVLIGSLAYLSGGLRGPFRMTVQVLVAVLIVACGTLTWRQSGIYRDPVTFFSHVISLNPEARDAHLNLAFGLAKAGQAAESLDACRVAVEQRPELPMAHSCAGWALRLLERHEEAEEYLRRSIELDPRHFNGVYYLGVVLTDQGKHEESLAQFRRALEIDARNAMPYAIMGITLFRMDRHEESIEALTKAFSLVQTMDARIAPTLHGLMGQASHRLGRLDEAAQHLQRAVEVNPSDASTLAELGRVRTEQKRFEEASDYLHRALALEPGSRAILQNIAEAIRKEGRYEEAIESYQEVLEIDPEYAPALFGMGEALFQVQRHQQAIDAMQQAISLQPDSPVEGSVRRTMGQALKHLGRLDEAAEHFRLAVQRDPGDTVAIDHLASLYFEKKRYDGANELYRELAELRPGDAQTIANLAATEYHLGRVEEAIRGLEQALSVDPDLETARSALEAIRQSVGQASRGAGGTGEAAAEQFRRALEVDPSDAAAVEGLAVLYFKEQRHEEANDLFRRLVELMPGDAQTIANLAATEYQLGRVDAAIEGFERALALDSTLASARSGFGSALRSAGQTARNLGRLDEAAERFRRAMEIDPSDTVAIDLLATLYFDAKRYRDANDVFRQLVELTPASALAVANLAATEYHLGRVDAAIEGFERALSLDPTLASARSNLEHIRGKNQRSSK